MLFLACAFIVSSAAVLPIRFADNPEEGFYFVFILRFIIQPNNWLKKNLGQLFEGDIMGVEFVKGVGFNPGYFFN